MATIKKGILGGIRGKLDGLTGQKRGIHDTISVNPRVDSIDWSSQTELERERMKFLCNSFRKLTVARVNQMFMEGPKNMTPFLRMVKANYKHCTNSRLTITDSMILKATMMKPLSFFNTNPMLSNGSMGYIWRNTPIRANESATDIALLFTYFPATDQWVDNSGVRVRSQGALTVNIGAKPSGTEYYQIMMFMRADGKAVSYPEIKHRFIP